VQEWWSAAKAQTPIKVSTAASAGMAPSNMQFGAPFIFISPTNQRQSMVCNGRLTDKDALLVTACDPYTSEAYKARTGLPCETYSFKDVSLGQFPTYAQSAFPAPVVKEQLDVEEETLQHKPMHYDMVICSFALHLLESPSEIWALLTALSPQAKWFVILEPHKKPEVKPVTHVYCGHTRDQPAL
jgi:hypothetical protein